MLIKQTAERARNRRVTRPARGNSAGRGARSESLVHTSAGLAIGREPTACRAQMAKARRRGSCLLRPVRGIALTDSVPTSDQHTTPRRLPTIADSGWRLARSSPGRAIPPVRSVSPPHPACIPTSFSSILPYAGSGVSLFRPASYSQENGCVLGAQCAPPAPCKAKPR